MSNHNHTLPIESSELIKKIKGLEFVREAHIESMNSVCAGNFNNTLNYKEGKYTAKVNLGGHCYKLSIGINGNRPNPKYEKQIKKCF